MQYWCQHLPCSSASVAVFTNLSYSTQQVVLPPNQLAILGPRSPAQCLVGEHNFFFSDNALLTCNSCIVKSTLLKCIARWFFNVQGCTSPLSNLRTFSSPLKETLPPLALYRSHSSLTPSPWRSLTDFSVSVHLPILDGSNKWSRAVCGPLCLVSFTERHVFKVHPPCGIYSFL